MFPGTFTPADLTSLEDHSRKQPVRRNVGCKFVPFKSPTSPLERKANVIQSYFPDPFTPADLLSLEDHSKETASREESALQIRPILNSTFCLERNASANEKHLQSVLNSDGGKGEKSLDKFEFELIAANGKPLSGTQCQFPLRLCDAEDE
ncbi:hypothetical protein CEXT_90241 [Caerostris extrusa]|uniref:Uncharacterized protein n=1 Tax=Caerostris extrusa TaxID=172846 RepID=A0AAV4X178_CAEEX|nr:hypothetical protein CEXT_90241 [Caerostris extrusa]